MKQLPWVTLTEEMPEQGVVVLVAHGEFPGERQDVFAGWLMRGYDGKYRWGRYTTLRGLEYVGEVRTTDFWARIPASVMDWGYPA